MRLKTISFFVMLVLTFTLTACDLDDLSFGDNGLPFATTGITETYQETTDDYVVTGYMSFMSLQEVETEFAVYLQDLGYNELPTTLNVAQFLDIGDIDGEDGDFYENDDEYLYVQIVEQYPMIIIVTIAIDKSDYLPDYTMPTPGDPTIPDSDVAGSDLTLVPRYPGSIRSFYTSFPDGERVDYRVESTVASVVDFYETHFNLEGFTDIETTVLSDSTVIQATHGSYQFIITVTDLTLDVIDIMIVMIEE